MSEATDGTAHASPFYCPYCGEQDIRPTAEERTFWCRTCDRVWTLRFMALGNREG
ncbi:MAG: hypothetical protein ABR552_11330 [Actinomycetota bacterium]